MPTKCKRISWCPQTGGTGPRHNLPVSLRLVVRQRGMGAPRSAQQRRQWPLFLAAPQVCSPANPTGRQPRRGAERPRQIPSARSRGAAEPLDRCACAPGLTGLPQATTDRSPTSGSVAASRAGDEAARISVSSSLVGSASLNRPSSVSSSISVSVSIASRRLACKRLFTAFHGSSRLTPNPESLKGRESPPKYGALLTKIHRPP